MVWTQLTDHLQVLYGAVAAFAIGKTRVRAQEEPVWADSLVEAA